VAVPVGASSVWPYLKIPDLTPPGVAHKSSVKPVALDGNASFWVIVRGMLRGLGESPNERLDT